MKEKETIEYLDLKHLVPFRNHPFKLRDGEEKEQLLKSIKAQGTIEPLIVRPLSESEYEVISGHRRMEICRKLGIGKLPVIVRNLTDEQAVSMMVDANLHRENILPSERAFAYKMKWEAAKKSEKALSQPATRMRNDDVIAQSFGIGKDTLHRYIRFSGLVFCADCKSKLHFCAAKSLKRNQEFFRCANYKDGRGSCTIHFIRDVVLGMIVKEAVAGLADFVRCYESVFLYMQKQKYGEFQKKRQQELKLSIENSRKRIADLDKLFSRIYEDNVIGKLSDERYARMAAEYESEQKELLEKVKEEEQQLSEMEQKSVDMRLLLQGLREFTDMKEMTPTIVNKLIRRIEVHNPEKKHARKSVKVDIYFTAVGLVSLPDEQEIRKMMEQIRSASQLPKQLTA